MLVVRQSPAAAIFQQIILPYLSTTTATTRVTRAPTPIRVQRQRQFSSSAARGRPPAAAATESEYAQQSTWEPYVTATAGAGPSTARQRERTREYLGLDHVRQQHDTKGDEDERNSAYERTTAMALERIIRSHTTPPATATEEAQRLVDKKGKGREVVLESGSGLDVAMAGSAAVSPISGLTASRVGEEDSTVDTPFEHPFPPIIYRLLQTRQFRLATLHIFNIPSLALNLELVERVAGYMDRHGGSKAARRLRRGRIPSPAEQATMSGAAAAAAAVADADIDPGSLVYSPLDAPRIGTALSQQERNTVYHNTQLVQLLHSSHTAKSSGLAPPKSFPQPNTSLRQLRALLGRIYKLEHHRGFVPDRVTANIILSCWVRCALAPNPDGARVVQTKSPTGGGGPKEWKVSPRHTGQHQGRFGNDELRKLFDLVSRLFDTASAPTGGGRAGAGRASAGGGHGGGLSYPRHVKPFVRIFQHGFRERRDRAALDNLQRWDSEIRTRLASAGRPDGKEEGSR